MSEHDASATPTEGVPDDLLAALPDAPDQHLEAALAEASGWVGSRGVEAVGLGHTDSGADCVVVYTSGGPADLPPEVGGLPVRVEASGPFQAYGDATSGPPPPSPVAPQPTMPPPGAGS